MPNISIKKPGKNELSDSQIVYSKAWRKALEGGAIIRAKLNDYLTEQGVWDKQKEKKYNELQNKINAQAEIINRGGVKVSQAKKASFALKRLRNEFVTLIAERNAYDAMTAEGCADNARFDYLVTVCVIDVDTGQPIFKDLDDYNQRGGEDWAIEAAAELAGILYGLDPKYEDNLPENKFLKRFKFIDEKGRLINKDGHLIAIDDDDTERLIDEEGHYIAYEDGVSYRVDRDGKRVEEVVQAPFLDDDGNPIDCV